MILGSKHVETIWGTPRIVHKMKHVDGHMEVS